MCRLSAFACGKGVKKYVEICGIMKKICGIMGKKTEMCGYLIFYEIADAQENLSAYFCEHLVFIGGK